MLKILCGMANSVDPDQTAPEDSLVFEILGHLPYCVYFKYSDI